MHGHLAARADSPVGRPFSDHRAHRRSGVTAVRAPHAGHAQARCPERRNGRAPSKAGVVRPSSPLAEIGVDNSLGLRSGYAHGGTDAHECRHVLAKQLGAVQTEGRAVRLLLPTGALHRRTDRAQGLVFPGCLPSRPASLTSPLRRGSESPPRGRTAVGRARGQLPTGGASGMGRRSDRSAGARPHGLHRRIESHGWAKGTVEQLSAHIDLRDPADVASRPRTCGACGSSSRSTRQAQDAQRC